MSFSAGNSGNTAKAIDGIEGATSGAPVSLPSGYIGSPRPATLADANVTLIATSNPDMVMTPTVTRTITLASTSIPANYVVRIVNKSPSVTINVNASGGGLVAIVAGGSQMTVMSNIPSPTVPADWNTNSYGDAFGPGSSVDNAIVRFDGTTGKLVQNSSATIDDAGRLSLTDTLGNGHILSANGTSAQVIIGRKTSSQGFVFLGADSTNALRMWSGGTGSDTPVLGSIILDVTQSGAVTLGPSGFTGTHRANGAINTNEGILNISASTTTTIFTVAANDAYIMYVTQGVEANVSASAIITVGENGTAAQIANLTTNANLVLSISGLDVRITNNAASTRTFRWKLLRWAR
jgi:hypothetical protein